MALAQQYITRHRLCEIERSGIWHAIDDDGSGHLYARVLLFQRSSAFHADWAPSAGVFEKVLLRDEAFFAAIAQARLPLVRIDHTHPSDATNKAIEPYSRARVVPTMVFFPGAGRPPLVLVGFQSMERVREAVRSMDKSRRALPDH